MNHGLAACCPTDNREGCDVWQEASPFLKKTMKTNFRGYRDAACCKNCAFVDILSFGSKVGYYCTRHRQRCSRCKVCNDYCAGLAPTMNEIAREYVKEAKERILKRVQLRKELGVL